MISNDKPEITDYYRFFPNIIWLKVPVTPVSEGLKKA
jgi:hypothetical protein